MAEKIELGIVVDTDTRATRQEFAALRREIKREADALGDDWESAAGRVEDALREAGARDDLLDAARRIGTEGPSEIEKMQRALRGLDDTASTTATDIKKAFGDNRLTGDDLFDANFRAEVAASARETGGEILGQISGALADGSLDTDTLATSLSEGLVEIGSELGGPAGAAMVAGGLIASALWGQVTAAKEAVQADVSSMFDSIIEQGAAAAEQGQLIANIRELTENQDKLNYSTKLATELNVELADVTRARAGDTTAMSEIEQTAHDQQMELLDAYNAGTIAADDYRRASTDISEALKDVTTDFDLERQGIDAAKAATDAYRAATDAASASTAEQALATAASTGQAEIFTAVVDGATRSLAALPNGKVVEVTDDGTVTSTQVAIDSIHGKTVEIKPNAVADSFQAAYDAAVRAIRPRSVVVTPQLGMRMV